MGILGCGGEYLELTCKDEQKPLADLEGGDAFPW